MKKKPLTIKGYWKVIEEATEQAKAEMVKRYGKYNSDFVEGVLTLKFLVEDLLSQNEKEPLSLKEQERELERKFKQLNKYDPLEILWRRVRLNSSDNHRL